MQAAPQLKGVGLLPRSLLDDGSEGVEGLRGPQAVGQLVGEPVNGTGQGAACQGNLSTQVGQSGRPGMM